MSQPAFTRSELILGGQKSGKSRRAETLARQWLDRHASHRVVLIVTAQALDAEMQQRIARHQADRAQSLPGIQVVEAPRHLAQAIAAHSRANTLVVVDCLTLWLTQRLMPVHPQKNEQNSDLAPVGIEEFASLLVAIKEAAGPLVLVSNEIGLGVIPMGAEVRGFVDALGWLNQSVAAQCQRVTLMAAGLPLCLKETS